MTDICVYSILLHRRQFIELLHSLYTPIIGTAATGDFVVQISLITPRLTHPNSLASGQQHNDLYIHRALACVGVTSRSSGDAAHR